MIEEISALSNSKRRPTARIEIRVRSKSTPTVYDRNSKATGIACWEARQYTMSGIHLTQLRKWMLESPPVEWGMNQLRELMIGALRQGQIPQHVAFVMDGNRRFARSHKIETVEGHNLGFEALARVCDSCFKS